jgi:hypothetical protein
VSQLDKIGGNFNKIWSSFLWGFYSSILGGIMHTYRPLLLLLFISWSSPAPSPGVSPPHSEHFPQCAECVFDSAAIY